MHAVVVVHPTPLISTGEIRDMAELAKGVRNVTLEYDVWPHALPQDNNLLWNKKDINGDKPIRGKSEPLSREGKIPNMLIARKSANDWKLFRDRCCYNDFRDSVVIHGPDDKPQSTDPAGISIPDWSDGAEKVRNKENVLMEMNIANDPRRNRGVGEMWAAIRGKRSMPPAILRDTKPPPPPKLPEQPAEKEDKLLGLWTESASGSPVAQVGKGTGGSSSSSSATIDIYAKSKPFDVFGPESGGQRPKRSRCLRRKSKWLT